jgi:hypothetical protein
VNKKRERKEMKMHKFYHQKHDGNFVEVKPLLEDTMKNLCLSISVAFLT